MAASVRTDAQGGVLQGKLSHIEPAADLKTRSFIVEIEVPNPERKLLPGMIATAELTSSATLQRLVIPQDFLVTGLDAVGVFINEAGVARFRPVGLGQVVRNQVVVEKGLSPGDSIVITGQRDLAAGDKLIVARSGKCCTDGRVVFE
jgi:RND family efflux transporter MFP subunit